MPANAASAANRIQSRPPPVRIIENARNANKIASVRLRMLGQTFRDVGFMGEVSSNQPLILTDWRPPKPSPESASKTMMLITH